MTAKKGRGILTGLGVTSILQSSSATTVMIVSFVNAGLITVEHSVGLIMGANIGTTITAWLVSILGMGKLSIGHLSLPLLAFGFPMLFLGKEKLRPLWGGDFWICYSLYWSWFYAGIYARLGRQPPAY